jgi:hypothetical protein
MTKTVICLRKRWKSSGSNHPICPTHQRLAKLSVVKDKMKDNYGRPFFVCADRHDPCNFWQWGDIYESPRPRCKHGIVCTVRKVKKDGPTQNRLFYCCSQIDSCGFFEWKEIEPRVTKTGFVLFSDPLQYRYNKFRWWLPFVKRSAIRLSLLDCPMRSSNMIKFAIRPLRYVHDYSVVDIVGNAFIELESRHRPQHIKIRWLPLTITPDDTLRRWTYSFLYILQENFHPYSLASLGTSCNDACTWVLQNSCTSRLCRTV